MSDRLFAGLTCLAASHVSMMGDGSKVCRLRDVPSHHVYATESTMTACISKSVQATRLKQLDQHCKQAPVNTHIAWPHSTPQQVLASARARRSDTCKKLVVQCKCG